MLNHWYILGAGAIGCLWAAHLAKAGHPVTLILRNKERLAHFRATAAITLETESGSETIPVNACLAGQTGPVQHLLITTKAYDTAGALDNVKAALHPRAGVVILQNGMGAQQQAAEQITPVPVWAGSTTDGAWLKAPFHVVFAGQGETRLGLLGSDSNPALPPGLSPSAELTLLADHNIELSLWQKLAINCAINPLTAWYDCPNGELAEHRHKHEHMARLCEEIEQLALAKGLLLFPEGVFKRAKQVALATRTNLSSMLQDVRHGRPTELNYITGYLLGEAHKLNMTLPANQQLFTHIRQGLKHNDLYSTD